MTKFFLLICALTMTIPQATGLKCFSCTAIYTDGEENPDLTCVNDPTAVPGKYYLTCPARMKYCTIIRHDFKGSGMVFSIERNCAENPLILNDDVEAGDLISHYRSCQKDLCNKGTGIESSDNGNGGNESGGMVVPGRSSAPHLQLSTLLTTTFSFYIFITQF